MGYEESNEPQMSFFSVCAALLLREKRLSTSVMKIQAQNMAMARKKFIFWFMEVSQPCSHSFWQRSGSMMILCSVTSQGKDGREEEEGH